MNKAGKIVIVIVLIVAVVVVITLKQNNKTKPGAGIAEGLDTVEGMSTKGLPRMVDLGADKCIPCKMMAPILEELKKEYAGRLTVEFIDVWEHRGAGDVYGIRSIPTQI